jgi:hypothetical protein
MAGRIEVATPGRRRGAVGDDGGRASLANAKIALK